MSLLILLIACNGKAPDPATETGPDRVPDPPDDGWMAQVPDAAWAETTPAAHGGTSTHFDPELRDAVTAYADCGAELAACLETTQGDFAACMGSVPICQTDTPWTEGPCCPAACEDAFNEKVAAGMSAFDAYARTIVLEPDCFPGLDEEAAR
ncbi:MAG: hypothetical protein H6739_15260 [Alphaproteobacteria bacterium]|nr:hypothetical protein [Alphaproteobacteria bacterium]